MWFDILKNGIYYHVTSPEYARVIIENQSIPVEQKTSMELPWIKEQFEPPLYKAGEPEQILFWKDLDEAKEYEKYEKMSKFNSRTVILKAELNTQLTKWPRDILVHSPRTSNVKGPLLKSAYAYFGNEDLTGNFEIV